MEERFKTAFKAMWSDELYQRLLKNDEIFAINHEITSDHEKKFRALSLSPREKRIIYEYINALRNELTDCLQISYIAGFTDYQNITQFYGYLENDDLF